jgi:hypothetical protein
MEIPEHHLTPLSVMGTLFRGSRVWMAYLKPFTDTRNHLKVVITGVQLLERGPPILMIMKLFAEGESITADSRYQPSPMRLEMPCLSLRAPEKVQGIGVMEHGAVH